MPISDVNDLWTAVRSWDNTASEAPTTDGDMDPRAVLDFKGGETAAWGRVQHYIGQGQIKGRLCTYKETRNGMVGADYSSKLSPYLSTGTVTARSVYAEVKAFEARSGIADENTYWLVFELLWRDYMRFYALKVRLRITLITARLVVAPSNYIHS
jgi:deoxyribodipyrimidine photo-lyase